MHAYLGEHITTHRAAGLGAKNLLGLPWRVAFALQEDGWILRNAIVWHKPNAMPESVRDRLNCRHELLFLLAKSPAYWFDLDPIREPHKTVHHREPGTARGCTRPSGRADRRTRPPKYGPGTPQVTAASRYGDTRHRRGHPNGRNPGDVWSVPTRPYNGPHFAAYPIDLPLRCIAAGCKPGGTVLDPFAGSGTTGLGRDPARPQIHRHRPVARLRPARCRSARPGRRRQDGGRAMNCNGSHRHHHAQRHRPRHHRRVRRRHAHAGGRLPAHRHCSCRPARRPRRPRSDASGARGGAAGPGEPARSDPCDPRGGR